MSIQNNRSGRRIGQLPSPNCCTCEVTSRTAGLLVQGAGERVTEYERNKVRRDGIATYVCKEK